MPARAQRSGQTIFVRLPTHHAQYGESESRYPKVSQVDLGRKLMKAVITSHARVTSHDVSPHDQFGYSLYGNNGLLHTDTVTLRTAKVFAAELSGSSAFALVMVAIAHADPQDYSAIVGTSFDDAIPQ